MERAKLILILFSIIWMYKLTSNIYLYYRTKNLFAKYKEFEADTDNLNVEIEEILPEVKEIFTKANIPLDVKVPFDNIFASGKIKPLYNISNNMVEIVAFYNKKFTEAKGYFKKGICDSFNPFYWIDFCIYFPQKLLNYLNIVNNIFIKIVNIVYWGIITIYLIKTIFKGTIL